MSFALAKQKGPAATWNDLRSERNKKRKRGSSIRKNNPNSFLHINFVLGDPISRTQSGHEKL